MYFYTYILAGRLNGVLYTGSTDDLLKRVVEHREKLRGGFTAKYGVSRLVWYELHGTRDEAFRRERQIKEWRRAWKLEVWAEPTLRSSRRTPGSSPLASSAVCSALTGPRRPPG